MKKTTNEIRHNFLDFFKEKGHIIWPSSPLVPDNDSTLLFTNAGMNQFKDFFLDKNQKFYSRVTTAQHCLRTGGKHNDLENVGYTEKHHTFFEMLGNFSFGDYFKKEAIIYAWELLTSKKWFNINHNRLWVSVYENDKETYKIWENIIKIPSNRIIRIGDKNNIPYNSDNFWQMGETGPCGPCTEIFYQYNIHNTNNIETFLYQENNFIEIWNIVFIEFNRLSHKKIIPLSKKSIDTGMGLERISTVLQNVCSNYKIDIFKKLIHKISYFSNTKNLNDVSLKIIADHIRSCSFLICENITPSNEHRGYVLRRIIRRTLQHAYKIGIKKNYFYKIVSSLIKIIDISSKILTHNEDKIINIIHAEEIQFSQTLEQGLKILNKEVQKTTNNIMSGKTAFYLYDTFGFPIDLTIDYCREKKIKVDLNSYNAEKENQKKRSNVNNQFYKNYNDNIIINDSCDFNGYKKNKIKSLVKHIFCENKLVSCISKKQSGIIFLDQTCFYPESGGQIGDIGKLYFQKKCCFIVENTKKFGNTIGHIGKIITGKITINSTVFGKIDKIYRNDIQLNHSATHLLHSTLRHVLGHDVAQKGSLVSNTHLRFDFSYINSLNSLQIQKIETIINEKIRDNDLIKIQHLTLQDAKKKQAIALFGHKYHSTVRVVCIKNFSTELCGGTHTKRTGNIGIFKITSYSNISSGVKRIEAITGQYAIHHLHNQEDFIKDISLILKSHNSNIKKAITQLILKTKNLEKKVDQLQKKENTYTVKQLLKHINNINGVKLLIHKFKNYNHQELRTIIDQLKKEIKHIIIVFINVTNHSYAIISGVTNNLTDHITATKIVNIFTKQTNGKGGGKKDIAEGGSTDYSKLPMFLKHIKEYIIKKLKKIYFYKN